MSKALELSKKYRTLLSKNGINTPLRLAHFFAQLDHESGLKVVSENLNYSAQGLANTWPSRYAVDHRVIAKVPNSIAKSLNRNPEAIANNVYRNRMGNGSECSGDGWKYRGRGFIQLTGKNNYQALSDATGIDYVSNPDLLLTEADAMIAALWFWTQNRLNKFADMDNVKALTKGINGGYNGLDHRIELINEYKKVF